VTEIADKSSNETLREHATQNLLDWSTDVKLAQGVIRKKAFDDGYRVMALHWFGAHQPDIARTTALQFIQLGGSEPLRVAAIQVLGVVKEKPGDHVVYDTLVGIAKETSFGARRAAIQSLAALGNKAAIPVLQPFTTHAPGGIRGAASAAIAALSK
jgi:HEAT repeat protein